MPSYTISGRIVSPDGAPVEGIKVRVKELASLSVGPVNKGSEFTTSSDGYYLIGWTEISTPASPWDLYVRAAEGDPETTVVESRLITDLASSTTVDIIVGEGTYLGITEAERIGKAIDDVLDGYSAADVTPSQLEWVSRRANVYPTLVATYIQAFRLSDARLGLGAATTYACLRYGLPADLPGLLSAGRDAWEDALRSGWERRLIPLPGDGSQTAQDAEVADQLAVLEGLVVDNALYDEATGTNRRKILDTAGLSEADQRTFTETWIANTGSLAAFWGDVDTALGSTKTADLQFTLQATALVGNHLETLEWLQWERGEEEIVTATDLAGWPQSRWGTFLTDHEIDPPEHITGANITERRQKYARALTRILEDAYPTKVLHQRLDAESSPPTHTSELVGFFENNEGFDITRTNISQWVAAHATAFTYASDGEQARTDLEIVQRVHRITPRLGRYETTIALLEAGITSAADVAAYTRDEFRERFSSLLPDDDHEQDKLAERIWDNATEIHTSAVAMASVYALAKSGAAPRPVQNFGVHSFAEAENGLDALDAILGDLDYCACKHCRSIFSPAAYLADLLKFLDDRTAESPHVDALTVLRLRRPDIEHILLDCDNTNTPLPQIDLVNELLERKFAETLNGSSPQTTWTAEQLAAHPEHILAGVYEDTLPTSGTKFSQYVHPWVLPFTLPLLESRTYLAHLQSNRAELMTLLRDGDDIPSDANINAEALGLSPEQWQIILGLGSATAREYWGFATGSGTDDWVEILNGTHEVPADRDPGELLRRGDYTLDVLRELLDLTFIDPDNYDGIEDKIEFVWSETCSLANASIPNLDEAALGRLHRFTRLQRATKIPPRALNLLIQQVGGGTLNETFLVQLPHIIALQQRTRLDYDVLATWWSDKIDAQAYTEGPASLYHRRFLTPELHAPSEFNPTDAYGVALAGDDGSTFTEPELAVLLAATRLSAADYATLLTAPGTHIFNTDDRDKFRFRFFTELVRATSYCRALGLSNQEFVILAKLFADQAIDPFASPKQTRDILELVDLIRSSNLSLEQVAWLLRHDFADKHKPNAAKLGRAFATYVRGLRTIAEEAAALVDDDGTATKLNLATVISTDLEAIMAILANTSVLDTTDKTTLINNNFASFTDTAAAVVALVTGGTGGGSLGGLPNDAPTRYAYVLREFIADSRRKSLLTDLATAELTIPAAAARALLFDVLTDPLDDRPLAQVFLVDFATEEEIRSPGITAASHPDVFTAWTRLHKAATIVRTFTIDPAQIYWYSDHDNWVDFDALPLATSDDKVDINNWVTLLQAMQVRDLFDSADGHQRLEDAVDIPSAIAVLLEANDWDSAEIAELLDNDHLDWPSVPGLASPESLIRLSKIAVCAIRSGVKISRLWSWIHPAGTEFAVANDIKAAARARHDDAGWAKIGPSLRDKIRAPQRDALVAATLAANPDIRGRDALSEELLIDVAMSPCMKTSRIVQAISSVQLFIHRTFLRLEAGDLQFKDADGDLWEWMKNYRVWEANRKVFLYPENWIKPGLRSDKTPEFQAMESALNQDTLDEYRVERALSGYLEALDTVSNLEIVGIVSDITEQGSSAPPADDIWILGRTQNAPHAYYIRHRGARRDWAPWEVVSLNIEGDNIAFVQHNNRLFLFWLVVHEETSALDEDSRFDCKRLSIAWSERTREGWSRVNMSERSPAFPDLAVDPRPERFRLQYWSFSDTVRLLVLRQPKDDVQVLATFDYDAISKKIVFSGANFDPTDEANSPYIDQQGYLHKKRLISLQGPYHFEGQRYVKDRITRADLHPGVRFQQGHFQRQLFKKGPKHGSAALLHQADHWNPDSPQYWRMMYCPVVYDDRRRKYLLEPTTSPNTLSKDGPQLDPTKLGPVDITGYLECTEATIAVPLTPSPPISRASRIRDNVTTRTAYTSSAVPGQDPVAIIQLPAAVGGYAITGGNEEAALTSGQSLMGNWNGLGKTDTDVDPPQFRLKIDPLYHPYIHDMIHALSRRGLPGIYDVAEKPDFMRQLATATPLDPDGLNIVHDIAWNDQIPIEQFDFEFGSTYGVYNWEIFYHVPTLIAAKLTTDQRFEEAQRWMHRIFDPIRVVEGEEGPEKFWRIKPFYEQATMIAQDQIEAMLGIGVTEGEQDAAVEAFEEQVDIWRANPFDPHAVARIRPGVYQRALLMQYFDNLIAWADNLFRRDTIESINEATMLYMVVGHLLGERPNEVPGAEVPGKSYADLAEEGLDALGNAAITLENWVLRPTKRAKLLACGNNVRPGRRRINVPIRLWYFCYPPNPELLKYWDIIDDRLWKIRHCRNIDGILRQLPLFQPPIDPALLVAAVAAGVDLSSALAELDSGLPPYRFRYIWGRAQTVTGELRSLGGALLSALEKRDAEELAVLRSGQEVSLLEAVRQVRIQRVQEAEEALEALLLSRTVVEHRRDHYVGLALRGVSSGEQDNLDKLEQARNLQIAAQVTNGVGAIVSAIPNLMIGTGAFLDFGGMHLSGVIGASAAVLEGASAEYSYQAGKALTNANYIRRAEDWQFQAVSADKELVRIDQDIATANLRIAIAHREVEDHDLQVSNARDVAHHMHDKYTNQQLYDWMLGELSTLYFQTYQLAFDLAKRAERAYRHELAIIEQAQPIIKYGYWDSLHKGLLAGERLGHDLARLDIAYMDKDVREYELRKSISLAQLAPEQLVILRETGKCDINIPEFVYDLDHPGHFMRRIRAVRLTIPAVVGPYTTLGATLQLVSHSIRVSKDETDYADTEVEDRFVNGFGAGQAIATSTAVTDAGLFNLDFKDERYLPFEYAGAVSSWHLRLPDPTKAPQFDYRTISDVVVHVDYTAREGGDDLRREALNAAVDALEDTMSGGYQLLVVQDAFPNEWKQFLNPAPSATKHVLTLPITERHFPHFAQRAGFIIDKIDAYLIPARSVTLSAGGAVIAFFDGILDEEPDTDTFTETPTYAPAVKATFPSLSATAQSWRLEIDTALENIPPSLANIDGKLDAAAVAGLLLVVHYKLT